MNINPKRSLFRGVLTVTVAFWFTEELSSVNGGEVVYFLVGPKPWFPIAPPLDDSYVLPIPSDRLNDLQHARALIASGGQIESNIVGARIAAGTNGINHNLQHPDLPAWNWHVTGFGGFGERFLDTADGYPSWVEAEPRQWLEAGIAFSSYTVVRELGEQPVFVRAKQIEGGLRLNWWSPGTNLVFTVESSASLTVPDWKPVSGTSWPISKRTWTSSGEGTGPYFRVLRANGPGN